MINYRLLSLVLLLWVLGLAPVQAGEGFNSKPLTHTIKPVSVNMGRATWDTGWFQAEVFKQLLEALGYRVNGPRTLESQTFYEAVINGGVDLWTNGWFPAHRFYLNDPVQRAKIELVGYQVKGGALQGYLVDAKSAEKFGIKDLTAFKDPELARVFDRDGNGKADLIGCNADWSCSRVIEQHLERYGLTGTVEQIQGDYSPLINETVRHYKQGQPVLFYTWTPNWTIGTLMPGRDMVWLQLPPTDAPQKSKEDVNPAPVHHLSGCAGDPCFLGFAPSDIRIVANASFLGRHPAIRQLAQLVTIPLDDINAQNARMVAGEDDDADIRRHAKEWIHKNRIEVDQWLEAARSKLSPVTAVTPATGPAKTSGQELWIATKRLPPFVSYQKGRYTGYSIELWENIARAMGVDFKLYGVNTTAKLLDEVKRRAADIAIGGIGITSKRENDIDFSHPFLESGFQIMVPLENRTALRTIFTRVFSILISPELITAVVIFLITLIIAAHLIWIMERRHNAQFSEGYLSGIWQSVWWALVTVTTVGYGDKTPKGRIGRLFGMVWILAGYFVLAYFTASVTSTVTVRELKGTINSPEDLFGKRVATVAKSPAAEYLDAQGLDIQPMPDIDAVFDLLQSKKVDAAVYDAPVLQHYASKEGKGKVAVVGLVFKKQSYGFALPTDSPYRESINTALLKLMEQGVYREIHDRWFGSQ